MTIAQTFRPVSAHAATKALYDVVTVALGSAMIVLSAQIRIELPFSPVPITGQTFAVLLVGLFMGSNRGLAAVTAYLVEGMSGLPVFAGGAAGAMFLAGPTGGYLIGFLPAAFATGYLAERRWDRNVWLTILAALVGLSLIYMFGLAWLSNFVMRDQLLAVGLYPFMIGAAIKVAAAATLLPSLRKFMH